VEKGASLALRRTIKDTLQNSLKTKAIASEIAERAQQTWSHKNIARRYKNLYLELIEQRRHDQW